MADIPLDDDDYTLAEGGIWLGIGTIALRILANDEGVSVTAYKNGHEMEDNIGELWLTYAEGEPDDDESNKTPLVEDEEYRAENKDDDDAYDPFWLLD